MSCVFWITGLSGSGKTTIASRLTKKLRQKQLPVIFLDGDIMRSILVNESRHDKNARREISLTYSKLCKLLSEQGIYVVCATISLFHGTQAWNRNNIQRYMEIFVRTSLDTLKSRDSKKIYSQLESGHLENVVGVDIDPEYPKAPDLIIDNDNETDINNHVDNIFSLFLEKHHSLL